MCLHGAALDLPQAGINQVHSWSTLGAQLGCVFQLVCPGPVLRLQQESKWGSQSFLGIQEPGIQECSPELTYLLTQVDPVLTY